VTGVQDVQGKALLGHDLRGTRVQQHDALAVEGRLRSGVVRRGQSHVPKKHDAWVGPSHTRDARTHQLSDGIQGVGGNDAILSGQGHDGKTLAQGNKVRP
jgi:hypothetical protein